jgi:hypothetical protein
MLIKGPPYLLTYRRRPKTAATVGTFGIGSSSTVPMADWLEEAGEDCVRKIHQIAFLDGDDPEITLCFKSFETRPYRCTYDTR